jgi:hypothetical protein
MDNETILDDMLDYHMQSYLHNSFHYKNNTDVHQLLVQENLLKHYWNQNHHWFHHQIDLMMMFDYVIENNLLLKDYLIVDLKWMTIHHYHWEVRYDEVDEIDRNH